MIFLLLQAIQPDGIVIPASPVPVMVETSPWNPTLIGLVFGGIVAIIGALGKVLVDLKQAKGKAVEAADNAVIAVATAVETKTSVESARKIGEAAGVARDGKLDEIKMLVDGKFSQVLDRVARLTRAIANTSGIQADIDEADDAQEAADKQRAKVHAAASAVAGHAEAKQTPEPEPEVVAEDMRQFRAKEPDRGTDEAK